MDRFREPTAAEDIASEMHTCEQCHTQVHYTELADDEDSVICKSCDKENKLNATETPRTDEILKYLEIQFPAVAGHIPLREMVTSLENDLNAAISSVDHWVGKYGQSQVMIVQIQEELDAMNTHRPYDCYWSKRALAAEKELARYKTGALAVTTEATITHLANKK